MRSGVSCASCGVLFQLTFFTSVLDSPLSCEKRSLEGNRRPRRPFQARNAHMTQEIEIDARGMKCPRPIIELAKARRRTDPGQRITITADDLAFESDVLAWCVTTGNKLAEIRKHGAEVTAVVEIL